MNEDLVVVGTLATNWKGDFLREVSDLEVVAGVHNVDSNEGQRVDVINTIVHESYDDEVRKIND